MLFGEKNTYKKFNIIIKDAIFRYQIDINIIK